MRLELAITLRYFRSRRGEGAVSFIAWVAIVGVMLGVAALVVAMSVMNGYQTNLVRAMAGALPHLSLHPVTRQGLDEPGLRKLIEANLPVQVLSPYVLHETLLRGPQPHAGNVQGVLVRAIASATESEGSGMLAYLNDGSPDWAALPAQERQARAARLLRRLGEATAAGVAPVLLSPALARKLGARLGERLVPLRFPRQGEGFSPYPTPARLKLIGYFETGIVTFDELVVLMDVERVAETFPGQAYTRALGVRLIDPLEAGAAATWLREALDEQEQSAFVYSWLESNRGLFQVIRVQKTMLFLVLLLIVVLAFFGMISALVMLVTQKTREITVLKSLGLPDASIQRVFVYQGLLIGLIGTGLGLAAGLGLCWVLGAFPLFEIPPGVYPGSDRVPVEVALLDVSTIVGATVVTCVVATLFPARKAGRLRPVEGLRYG